MKFIEFAIVTLLSLLVRVFGQCDNSAGCFPPTGNIALFRNISSSSTCGENGTTFFSSFNAGSGLEICSTDDPAVAYPASNINDNDTTTAWQSDTGVTNVTVQLDLEGPMRFENLTIIWSTPRPSAMFIERSSDFGITWMPYRYFATSCVNFFMINDTLITPDTILTSTEAVCTPMATTVFPFSGSEVVVLVLVVCGSVLQCVTFLYTITVHLFTIIFLSYRSHLMLPHTYFLGLQRKNS